MNVFSLRNTLIQDYSDYIGSFVTIKDEHIKDRVDKELFDGALWPDPLIQLNPNFQPGDWVDDLVKKSKLEKLAGEIFRVKKSENEPKGSPMRLHRHQTEAIDAAQSGDSYVLSTGTGSGKSLSYIVPVVNHVLRHGSGGGIKAVIIYPMNALANSQLNELDKFLKFGLQDFPVTYKLYTGQQRDKEERDEIINNPPDILLTNYVMLELLMTRPEERKLVEGMKGLQFLVLDELHTYRGRQGADVAMLIRRVRERSENPALQVVGTSATLAGGGTFADQQKEIAKVATRLFGTQVKPERVIGETLQRATPDENLTDPAFRQSLTKRISSELSFSTDYDTFRQDPLASWIETTFGLTNEEGSGRLKRTDPISISGVNGAGPRLAEATGLDIERCEEAIEEGLLAGYGAVHPETGLPVFAFRLHQFISRGDTVYASLEESQTRHITLNGQKFVPGDRNKKLLPLAFCRECGHEYYVVRRLTNPETGETTIIPRELRDQVKEEDQEHGFLYRNEAKPWPDNDNVPTLIKNDLLPEDWLEQSAKGEPRVKSNQRKKLPEQTFINPAGLEDPSSNEFFFVRSPFPFCLNCGVTYTGRDRSDFGKLSGLSSEGRSTATTILTLSAYRTLKRDTVLEQKAKKLLSFTDNRQDASLQAGHFNDFVEVGLLRSALYRAAADAGEEGLTHDELPNKVFEALDLPFELYGRKSEKEKVTRRTQRNTDETFRQIIGYRLYNDLRRGWRLTAPNLEQCGLLIIDYADLKEVAEDKEIWQEVTIGETTQGLHPALATASPEVRYTVCHTLLDLFRREQAIRTRVLDPTEQEKIKENSFQHLCEPWAIDDTEDMSVSSIAIPGPLRLRGNSRDHVPVSGRGGFGQYLRRINTFPDYEKRIDLKESEQIIQQLFAILNGEDLIDEVEEAKDDEDVAGYQIPADIMIWKAGDGSKPFRDPIRRPRESTEGAKANQFFIYFYQEIAADLQNLQAREHTAQVPSEEREQREDDFREAKLPVLYCSPTMELGVDISQLNVVNMRNVPPTPANYAQRSGRAGRSGQPALVFTYCTSGSPHDQYFFKRPSQMVSGSVSPPRLDLANEDLIRAHVNSVWLAETGESLGASLAGLIDIERGPEKLDIVADLRKELDKDEHRNRARKRLETIFSGMAAELAETDWYSEDWLARTLRTTVTNFELACDRWRSLYRSAIHQRDTQHEIITDASRPKRDKDQARRLRGEAESQISLLTDSGNIVQSDFYSYRYFASEGFLPGYNFPRLPLSAYVSARRTGRRSDQDEYLSRPRFLAISEYGPRSIIYHEGSRYVINRVILPVGENGADSGEGNLLQTSSIKICPECGYLHILTENSVGLEQCEFCQTNLTWAMNRLFRMQNVSTRRRDRINSDEEERVRMGYEIQTSVRFEERDHRPAFTNALVKTSDGQDFASLTYGDAATLWRVNLGWRRRKDKAKFGFVIDAERGYWSKNEQEVEDDKDDPMSTRKETVIPYVEDRRNSLLIEFKDRFAIETMASIAPAIKSAIQICYQLEDNELAVEPLPTRDDRRVILLYESAEGGAGVLRQLVSDSKAINLVARTALDLCHFDPDTREDQRRAPTSKEDCEAACYDCLMSYFNQPDHELLDRKLALTPLYELAHGTVRISPSKLERSDFITELKKQCDSDLEREWLDFINEQNLRLPDQAQKFISQCNTQCDFYYSDKTVAIYIDGPHHDRSDKAKEDRTITDCLTLDLGLTVLRFRYDQKEQWDQIINNHAYVFGKVHA